MFVSLLANLTVLPALLALRPLRWRAPRALMLKTRALQLLAVPVRYPMGIRILAVTLAATSILSFPYAKFDHNPLNLRDPDVQSVRTLRELLRGGNASPWTGVVLTSGASEAARTKERLKGLASVDEVVTLQDFVPQEQDEKLALIEEISILLGPDLEATAPAELDLQAQVAALDELLPVLEAFRESSASRPFANSLDRLLARRAKDP